jgi:hypothetical protein
MQRWRVYGVFFPFMSRQLDNSIDLIEGGTKKIDNASVAEESYECTIKYFEKVISVSEKLIVEQPEKYYFCLIIWQ